MKHKKHHPSDDDSADSADSDEASDKTSSMDSDSDSEEYDRRHKKRKRYASSSQSESDSSDEHQKRSKKRKHKKKKKKHSKKKRHVESAEESDSNGSYEHKGKSKHKHKHSSSKKTNSSTGSQYESDQNGYKVHSTVKETHHSTEDHRQPHATYYQKPYHGHGNNEGKREEEVQRFYRGSSKDRYSQTRREHFHDNREHATSRQRCETSHEGDYRKTYHNSRGGYDQREYSRGDVHHGHPRQIDVPKRHNYDEGRKYEDRRGYPPERLHGREYQDNRERYRNNQYPDRGREPRREKMERPPPAPAAHFRETSRSRSPRRPDRYHRSDERRRPDDRRYEHRSDRPIDRKPDVRMDDRRREHRPEDAKRPPPKHHKSRFATDENKEFEWGKSEVKKEGSPSAAAAAAAKEKPNFGLSGKLTADANTVNGVVIKYTEPDDAKQPKRRWRFYPFKGDKSLPILFIHRQSCFILGREKKVVDIHLEHPSVSKQHAALQYRATPFQRADGTEGRRVRPYVIDLDSANGTFVNNKKIEARRYVELLERDVVKFGFSAREYVLLHENSKDDAQDDDNLEQPAPEVGVAVVTTHQIKLDKHNQQAAAADGD